MSEQQLPPPQPGDLQFELPIQPESVGEVPGFRQFDYDEYGDGREISKQVMIHFGDGNSIGISQKSLDEQRNTGLTDKEILERYKEIDARIRLNDRRAENGEDFFH